MTSVEHPIARKGTLLPFILVTALFFFWGIPNNLNDILIKQFMKSFEINRFQAGLVQSAFYMGYFLLSLPAALIMQRFSYKIGLVIGLLLFSTGTFLFYPAALSQTYGFFLVALFVIASGLAFLETGANPFIAVIGDTESSARRLNFSQAFNPIGAISGVLIGTIFIFSGIELSKTEVSSMKLQGTYNTYLQHETMRIVTPYLILGAVVLLWAIIMMFTRFPKLSSEKADAPKIEKGGVWKLFRYPHFLKGVLAQFFYIGAQVGTWSYFIQYVQDYTHQPEKVAGYFLTGTLFAFGVGRFSAAYFMRFVKPNVLMGTYGIMNIMLVLIGITMPGWIGLWAVFFTSFFMSLMFPTIFALSIHGLGPYTKLGASMVVMAIIGGAVFTPVMGLVFMYTKSMAFAMFVPLFCYVVITWYAFLGSKPGGDLYLSENTTITSSH
jgi:MFS transporter, FHS family, L-fucose permease